MKTVRDRADARWLPSRFRYALFRLAAFGIIRRSRPREASGLVLVIDRDQSASEYYVISVWLLLTVSCYVGACLSRITNGVVAAIAAIPLASLLIEAVYLSGAAMPALMAAGIRQERSLRVASMMLYGLLILAAAYFVLAESWVRYVAISFLVIVAVNAIAAVVVWSLRRRIADLERAYGVAD
jgi:FtsH-binding integral membrane protein